MLTRSLGLAIVASFVWTATAEAQQSSTATRAASSSDSTLMPTPEMWYYQQERERYEDPQLTVRRKAEFRGEQRRLRLVTRKWYGHSPERPLVHATPWGSGYYSMRPYRRTWPVARLGGSRAAVVITPSEY